MEVPSSPPECLTSPKDEPQSLPRGLDCSSPLGLFEKFRLDDFPVHEDENDDDLQLVSLVQAPDIASEKMVDDDVVDLDTWDKPDAAKARVRRRKSMLWVVNANTLCPVSNRREEDQCRLIGSWDTESAELRRMEELEDPWEEDDLYIVEQDISSPLNEKSDEDDVICVEIADGRGLLKPYGNNVFVKRKCSDHLHADQTTPKRKRKISEKQKAQPPIPKPVEMGPEDVRNNTVHTLSDVLLKRVHDTPDLHVLDETIRRVAENVEEEMYKLFSCTDNRYKNKYRSLHFNLRDPKNKVLFQRVVLGEITPECLVLMTATEMAGQELADWRNQERKHTLELIEREEREPRQINITKLTHKGLIEIDTMPDQNLTLEDLSDSVWQNKNVQPERTTKDMTSQHETAQLECTSEKKDTTSRHEDAQSECTTENKDTTSQHKSHLLDQNCLICTGVVNPDEADLTQWIKKSGNKRKRSKRDGGGNPSNCLKKGKKKTDPHPDLTDLVPSGVWKGFIHMFSIKQFKVTGTQVSGYNSHLCQALPSVLTSKGCICPESVWEHVDRIWPECTKDMCVMQLNPRTSSDAIAYTRVYSYLNRKVRYGIIRCENMEAFLVPLPASQPIPQRLHPLGGPGLEDNHPMLLLAVLLPNHPSSTAFPKKQSKKQQENVDIPDDIFSDILADVEREERQMAEHGLPPPGIPGLEQFHQNFGEEAVGEEVDKIMNMLRILTSSIQLPGAYLDTTGEDQGPNIMPYFFQPNVLPTGVPFPPFPTYPEVLYPGWHGMIPSAQTANPMPIDPNILFPYPLSQVIPPNFLPDQNFAAGGQPYT